MSDVVAAPLMKSQTGAGSPPTRGELHRSLAPFAKANSFQGYKSFAIDITLYALGIAGVLLLDAVGWKILGGLLAGLALVNLGSISHEAAHRTVVKSKAGNKAIAVITLTMILFNYRLWIYDHHVLHHGRTNVKDNNFLSPLTLEEYRAKPAFYRALYRAYHSPSGLGILLYFLLERWPTVHYYPGAWLPKKFHASALGYTALMTAWMAALLSVLVLVPSASGESVLTAVLCGFVLPYTIWFFTFSMTAYLQHTNPQLRWYRDVASMASPSESTSIHVGIPHWMNHMTHYVLEHPVHHVTAMIPHYNLKAAQKVLAGAVPPNILTMQFTPWTMADVLRRCRIYDYDAHAWLNFAGEVTAIPVDTSKTRLSGAELAYDDLLPDEAEPDSPGVFFPAEQGASMPEVTTSERREDA